ncbi:MAG: hypothetical protein A3G18_10390 [Rhodospirillales bacterium RIFCSPLOWO2_12_FULL_58_28]|nr:MAG: hypothetical protein A3H92_08565 [Rhodospirillales bacterium RIFCSPLOWO2_02_FULL_58_16]OHC77684.1 MAG: hypothetical protein A3G18_10390 [Rhodospirillales bacterium RIFCSPLOWO2_12_FULL_58_28]
MQHKLIETIKRYWPNAWLHILADYDGAVPLQSWLDANVVWRHGSTPPTAVEIEARLAEYEVAVLTESRKAAIDAVKIEAEARITKGAVIGGNRIKCDAASIGRLHGMVTAGGRKGAGYSRTFMTDAGVRLTLGKAQVETIFDVAEAFVATVLDRSAAVQEQIAAMTAAELAAFNPANDANWP